MQEKVKDGKRLVLLRWSEARCACSDTEPRVQRTVLREEPRGDLDEGEIERLRSTWRHGERSVRCTALQISNKGQWSAED